MPTIYKAKERGPITAQRHSPPNVMGEGDKTTTVSYIVMMYEVGGMERPIASHDDLASCEEHIVRLVRDASDHLLSDRWYYSWVAVERYPG